jgi:hypothetical protein
MKLAPALLFFPRGNSIPCSPPSTRKKGGLCPSILKQRKGWVVFNKCLADDRFHAKAGDFYFWPVILSKNEIELWT